MELPSKNGCQAWLGFERYSDYLHVHVLAKEEPKPDASIT